MLPINPFITSDGIDFICMDFDINVSEAHALFDFAFTEFEKGLQKVFVMLSFFSSNFFTKRSKTD
ncbi:MAG: hypothetical protein R3A45_13380 [Bdellovibrionota bacterium]